MKKILSLMMTLIMVWSLTVPALAAETATAATLRLARTEGTVTVKNASGKQLTLKDGMRLYSGSKIKTGAKSYAYISLDDGKAVKLGASSEGEVRKSGKKLELNLLSGELFFDVSVPLKEDESLKIRTSTMVTGVRGTVGYVRVTDRFHSEVGLLEGKLQVQAVHEGSGASSVDIVGGEKAISVLHGTEQEVKTQISVLPLVEDEVPGFAAVEVAENTDLQDRIEAKSDMKVEEIVKDAQERLENEQQEAAAAAEDVLQQVEQQKKESEQEQPNQVFEPDNSSTDSGSDNDSSSSGGSTEPSQPEEKPEDKPEQVRLDVTATQEDLINALAEPAAKTVILSGGANLTLTAPVTVPEGKTLILESSARLVVDQGGWLTVSGTVTVESGAELVNNGTLAILSGESVHVIGTLRNGGSILVGGEGGTGLLAMEKGGLLESTGAIQVGTGSSLTNSGSMNVQGTGTVRCSGSLVNGADGTLTLTTTAAGTESFRLCSGGGFTNKGTVRNRTLFTVEAPAVFRNEGSFCNGESDQNTAVLSCESTECSNTGSFINYGTVRAGGFTNEAAGTFTNYGIVDLDSQNSSFVNRGTFINENSNYRPTAQRFATTGSYQDDAQNALSILVTNNGDGVVQYFGPLAQFQGWSGNEKAVLCGASGKEYIGALNVEKDNEVLLDLNGRSIDLGEECLVVSGALTVQDSTAKFENESYLSGKITSAHPKATIQTKDNGSLTLVSGIIENTYQSESEEGGHAVEGNLDQQGGVLRALVRKVWDQIQDGLNDLKEGLDHFFELITGKRK